MCDMSSHTTRDPPAGFGPVVEHPIGPWMPAVPPRHRGHCHRRLDGEPSRRFFAPGPFAALLRVGSGLYALITLRGHCLGKSRF